MYQRYKLFPLLLVYIVLTDNVDASKTFPIVNLDVLPRMPATLSPVPAVPAPLGSPAVIPDYREFPVIDGQTIASATASLPEYSTYTYFLAPSVEWLSRNNPNNAAEMKKAFHAFGDAIGKKNVAIWLAGTNGEANIASAKDVCDWFGLGYNDGPYVIVAAKPIENCQDVDEVVIIRLTDLDEFRSIRVLNTLEQDLRQRGRPNREELLYVELRERLIALASTPGSVIAGLLKFVRRSA